MLQSSETAADCEYAGLAGRVHVVEGNVVAKRARMPELGGKAGEYVEVALSVLQDQAAAVQYY